MRLFATRDYRRDQRYSYALLFCVVLGLGLVLFKFAHVIDWPWWVVMAPFWGIGALVVGVGTVWAFVAVIEALFSRTKP